LIPSPFSPTVASIDLSALSHNLAVVRRHIAPACRILAVVKADAYGHGAVPIAGALAKQGVTAFGVATVQEGLALRHAGIDGDILVLGGLYPEQIPDILGASLTPVVYSTELLSALADSVPAARRPYPVHVKVDTGMTRLGLDPKDARAQLPTIARSGTLRLAGLMTHLADADCEDGAYTTEQIGRFQSLVNELQALGVSIPLAHAANSAGILFHPASHFTMVRPGLMLYGYGADAQRAQEPLSPVLSLTAKVLQVRSVPAGQTVSYSRDFTTRRASKLAVLSIGYADGYPRALSNRGAVLLHGRRAPIVGRVCMDLTIVDVTDIPAAQVGDDAVLIGGTGGAAISAQDLADWADTIPYEILSTIGPRATRIYR